MEKILEAYGLNGKVLSAVPFGNGHINDTILLKLNEEGAAQLGRASFGSSPAAQHFSESAPGAFCILQKINKYVFKKPWELMDNAVRITEHLRKKIAENGGDVSRETLTFFPTLTGDSFTVAPDGEYWRLVEYIDGATCYDEVSGEKVFREAGRGFGRFQRYLADFPADSLYETIPDFHNTRSRFDNLMAAAVTGSAIPSGSAAGASCNTESSASPSRAENAAKEIAFYKEREHYADFEAEEYKKGNLKLRVTHNDTKLNNVMIDDATGKALCVLDLDTVMPGFAINDFGDAIRFGASTAAEDEQDLSKVELSVSMYKAFEGGFLEEIGESLTDSELKLMPAGARNIIFEQGMRFLTDYLMGDVYFKVDYPEHNLVRARTHIKLLEEVERKWDLLK